MAERRPDRPVTLATVARHAGVSTALASLALNGRPGVAEASRRRILAAADALGYRGNVMARSLRTGRSGTAAMVLRNLGNPFFLDVVLGAQAAALADETTIVTIDADYSVERERQHLRTLAGRSVDGLAIAPTGDGAAIDLWQQLRPGTPVVVLNAVAPAASGVTRVAPDGREAVRLAMAHLAELGHRDVAFLTAPATVLADHDRLAAFLELSPAHGITPRPLEAPLNPSAVREAVGSLLRSSRPPTALVTNSDHTAHAVYRAVREAGLAVGRDLSVVGHDDLETSELLDPPLTTIRVDRRALGVAVYARLADPHLGNDHLEPVELVVRDSTGPASR